MRLYEKWETLRQLSLKPSGHVFQLRKQFVSILHSSILQLPSNLQSLSHMCILLFRLLVPRLHPPFAIAHLEFRVLEVLMFRTTRSLHCHFLCKVTPLLMLLCRLHGLQLSLILTQFSSPLFSTFPRGHRMPKLLSYQICAQTSAKKHPCSLSEWCEFLSSPGVSLVVWLKVVTQTGRKSITSAVSYLLMESR